VKDVVRRSRLRLFDHIERRPDYDWCEMKWRWQAKLVGVRVEKLGLNLFERHGGYGVEIGGCQAQSVVKKAFLVKRLSRASMEKQT